MHYSVNNIQLNVIELGNGPLTLVFLHYFGGSALEWTNVMNQLANQYRCVAVDLRGHGDSAAPPGDYSVNTMADDIMALLILLGIDTFVLIGHSMGGKVALAVASRQPTRLQNLLLLSPSPPVPEPIADADRQNLLETHGQRSAAEKTFTQITSVPLPERAKQQIITDNLRSDQIAWRSWLTVGSKEDISSQVIAISVPVAILAGTADTAIPTHVHTTLTKPYLRTATLDFVAGVGHLLPWEAPDNVTAFIRKQLTVHTKE
ncbi:alpha/beta hydrolase [Spirosoma sp. BT702]|uniref:Alpha/beta hydrolase n=1 Tax=Spirosoma profusum TaxID=2771354 RepID=A0A926XXD7_9BACT|nr:alpha/beta hydrolase [Spirosoma profusum]MBD2702457.1 alpha/beta hydrolase [Spirosoma profusum]